VRLLLPLLSFKSVNSKKKMFSYAPTLNAALHTFQNTAADLSSSYKQINKRTQSQQPTHIDTYVERYVAPSSRVARQVLGPPRLVSHREMRVTVIHVGMSSWEVSGVQKH
jgi:hypothetical protein